MEGDLPRLNRVKAGKRRRRGFFFTVGRSLALDPRPRTNRQNSYQRAFPPHAETPPRSCPATSRFGPASRAWRPGPVPCCGSAPHGRPDVPWSARPTRRSGGLRRRSRPGRPPGEGQVGEHADDRQHHAPWRVRHEGSSIKKGRDGRRMPALPSVVCRGSRGLAAFAFGLPPKA